MHYDNETTESGEHFKANFFDVINQSKTMHLCIDFIVWLIPFILPRRKKDFELYFQ